MIEQNAIIVGLTGNSLKTASQITKFLEFSLGCDPLKFISSKYRHKHELILKVANLVHGELVAQVYDDRNDILHDISQLGIESVKTHYVHSTQFWEDHEYVPSSKILPE